MPSDGEVPVVVRLKMQMIPELTERMVDVAAQNKQLKSLIRKLLVNGHPGYVNMPIGVLTHIYADALGEDAYSKLLEANMVTHLNWNVVGESEDTVGESEET
jgi:hypothetical protein